MIFQKELLNSLYINHDRVAIDSGEKVLSYHSLLNISNKITKFLLDKKLNHKTIIGIQLDDRSDLICAIVGILNARCTFVPINYSLPEARVNLILKDLNLKYLISSKKNTQKNEAVINDYFIEDILAETDNINPNAMVYPQFDKDDGIYVYFTSGTTGKPKGIIGKNCSLLQFIQWEIQAFEIDNNCRVSQFISPYFDAFLRDIFVPLLVGGTICIPPQEDDFFSPEKIIPWIENTDITLIHCVPSLFRVINDKSLNPDNFRGLKEILLSGERIIPSELENWYKVFGSRIQIVNLYGATESTMIRSFYKIIPDDVFQDRISIGGPISETKLLVANADFKPCPRLVSGTLYIISDYLTKGYLNSPELTNDVFVKLNFNGKQVLAYRTGDKARVLADGRIDLIGREDRQIKLRGIRIELDELETILIRSGLVEHAVVIKKTEQNGNEHLIAFIVKNELGDISDLSDHVFSYLEKHLPQTMMPSDIILLNELPLLTNGKIDYSGLLAKTEITQKTIYAPTNVVEDKLLVIWKEILGDKIISIEDSFHLIGGDSLAIMRLIGRIYQEFNIRISLSELFKNLSIKKQAEFIKEANADNTFIIKAAPTKLAYNLSSAQERIYLSHLLDKESTAYNLPMAWEIKGKVDKNKIEDVLKLLIKRHESLRTEFIIENDKILQVVKDDVNFHVEEIKAKGSVHGIIAQFIKPFDLSNSPLLRCAIIYTHDAKSILVIDMHHIVCDAVSQLNLYSDFLNLYNGRAISALSVHYKDYSEWEYSFKATAEYIAHRAFWLKSFEEEIPKIDLPLIHLEDIEDGSDKGGSLTFSIDKTTIHRITEVLKTDEITTFSSLFSLYYLFLYQLTSQVDIVIGTSTSGRIQAELEPVVGMFSKTLPIRYRMESGLTFKAFAKEINRFLIEANSKQIYDLSDILNQLNASRTDPIKTLFDVMFVYHNFEETNITSEDIQFSGYEIKSRSAKYLLTLFTSEDKDVYNFQFVYASLYFTKEDIEALALQFQSLTKDVSENLDAQMLEYSAQKAEINSLKKDNITFNF